MSVQLNESTEITNETSDPLLAHIIAPGEDGRSADTIILEARVMGIPISALCGYVWVPSRDPMKYPMCEKCIDIFEFDADFRS